MGWDYSEKTKQIFMDAVHGKPGTHMGEIDNPDGFGEHGSIACGDALRFTFRVERDPQDPLKDVIVEARYLTFGCTSAIAASEALCSLIEQGRYTPITALKITNRDIVDYLEGLPEQKIHCSVMGAEALEAAVFNWAQKRGVDLRQLGIDIHAAEQEEGRIVCNCFTLSEPYIRRKIVELGLQTIPEITGAIKAGGACMSCHHVPGGLQDLLDEIWGRQPTAVLAEGGAPLARMAEQTGAPAGSRSGPASPERGRIVVGAAGALGPAGAGPGGPGGGDGGASGGGRPASGAVAEPAKERSPYQFAKLVEKTCDEYIRPLLRRDGGDLEIIDIKDKLIYCRLIGVCAGCGASDLTLRLMVEKTLKDRVDESIRVISA